MKCGYERVCHIFIFLGFDTLFGTLSFVKEKKTKQYQLLTTRKLSYDIDDQLTTEYVLASKGT